MGTFNEDDCFSVLKKNTTSLNSVSIHSTLSDVDRDITFLEWAFDFIERIWINWSGWSHTVQSHELTYYYDTYINCQFEVGNVFIERTRLIS